MSMPGWYPDPAGGQGRFRYWDGNSWSNQITSNPADPAPRPGGPARRSGGSGGSWTWLIVTVAALVVVGLIAWFIITKPLNNGFDPAKEDTNSSTPTVQGWDETSKPTPPPTEQASMVACPVTLVSDETKQRNDGRLRGGGLSVAEISSWRGLSTFYLQWVSDIHSQYDTVRTGWMSNIAVGQLNTTDGFTSPQISARQSMDCYASSGYYENFTHRVDLVNEPVEISGHPAWHMRSEVRISASHLPGIEGDLVDIYVVDIGDAKRMGIFFSSVTIGDTQRQKLVDDAIATLTVG